MFMPELRVPEVPAENSSNLAIDFIISITLFIIFYSHQKNNEMIKLIQK